MTITEETAALAAVRAGRVTERRTITVDTTYLIDGYPAPATTVAALQGLAQLGAITQSFPGVVGPDVIPVRERDVPWAALNELRGPTPAGGWT